MGHAVFYCCGAAKCMPDLRVITYFAERAQEMLHRSMKDRNLSKDSRCGRAVRVRTARGAQDRRGIFHHAIEDALIAACFIVGTMASTTVHSQAIDENDNLASGATAASPVKDTSDLYAALLSWAVILSGLPKPAQPPQVRRMPHAFFVRNACSNRECRVLGWFPPGDTIYLDQGLDPENNLLAASIVVHEMVHFLQFRTARTAADFSCDRSIELERQAYGVQREFITRYGVYHPVGASMHQVGCDQP